jgi:hypothetical protein
VDSGPGEAGTLGRAGLGGDRRLPCFGTLLTRQFENRTIVVKVLENGFEYQAQRYRSLSAVAGEVTGTRWNGLRFVALMERRDRRSSVSRTEKCVAS